MSKLSELLTPVYNKKKKFLGWIGKERFYKTPEDIEYHHQKSKDSSTSTEEFLELTQTYLDRLHTVSPDIIQLLETVFQRLRAYSSSLEELGREAWKEKLESQSSTQTQTQEQPQEKSALREQQRGTQVDTAGNDNNGQPPGTYMLTEEQAYGRKVVKCAYCSKKIPHHFKATIVKLSREEHKSEFCSLNCAGKYCDEGRKGNFGTYLEFESN